MNTQNTAILALVLALAAFLLSLPGGDASRARRRVLHLLASTAATGAAVAAFIALQATDARLRRIEGALAQRPVGITAPGASSEQLQLLAAGLAPLRRQSGLLFAVLSTCGSAQTEAASVVSTMRGVGLTVYAPPQCGPVGTTTAMTVIVNAHSRHPQPARQAAAIFGSVFPLPDTAPNVSAPVLSADVIVLLAG